MKNSLILIFLIISTFVSSQTIDETFKPQFLSIGSTSGITVQPDNKILIFGNTNYIISSKIHEKLFRLNSDGTLDNSFLLDKKVIGNIYTCNVDSNGNIYIGGKFNNENGEHVSSVYRLKANGEIDNSFSNVTYENLTVNEIRFFKEGNLLINFTNPLTNKYGVLLLNNNGTINENFNKILNLNASVIETTNENEIIINYSNNSTIDLKIYDQNGNFVKTLTSNFPFGSVIDIELLENENIAILVSGGTIYLTDKNGVLLHTTEFRAGFTFNDNIYQISELEPNVVFGFGTKVYKFNTPTLETGIINDVAFDTPFVFPAILDNGNIVCVGNFTKFNNELLNGIVSLKSDNNKLITNSDFQAAIYTVGSIFSIISDDEGDLYVGGNYVSVNNEKIINLSKIDSEGEVISSVNFQKHTNTGSGIYKLALNNENNLIVGSSWRPNIDPIKFNGLSTIDINGNNYNNIYFPYIFNGASSIPSLCTTSANDIIAIEGGSIKNGDDSQQQMIKFNKDGGLISNYNQQYLTSVGLIHDVSITEKDELILIGHQIEYEDGDTSCIAMVNANGTRKQSFNPKLPINYRALSSSLFEKSIYLGGVLMNGYVSTGAFLVKLNENGDLDANFSAAISSNNDALTNITFIMPINDNKILVHGTFNNYNGESVKNNTILIDSNGVFIKELNLFTQASNALRSYVEIDNEFYIVGNILTEFGGVGMVKLKDINSSTEIESQNSIVAYPNPTSGEIFINSDIYKLKIYDTSAKLIYETAVYKNNTPLNFSNQDGLYLVMGVLNNGKQFHKLIIKY